MRIGRLTNGDSCEFLMQLKLCEWLREKDILFVDEKRVKQIRRIADFLIIKNGKLINIEAKSLDFKCLLEQMNDHAIYCDYSFAFIPDFSPTPRWFKEDLANSGYGLMIWNNNEQVITEVLEAHYNKPKNKDLQKQVYQEIKSTQINIFKQLKMYKEKS